MKTYEQINDRIASGKAVVLTADEIMDYVDKKGVAAAAKEVDVVTTATFGPMCSSGCFLNFGHSKPRIRMSEAWIEDVLVYAGVAAVDVYLGATQLRHADPANMYYPGEFRYGGGHVIEDLVAGKALSSLPSHGTDSTPREIRTYFDRTSTRHHGSTRAATRATTWRRFGPDDLHVPGHLEPRRKRDLLLRRPLSPLLNDPYYETIGVGTRQAGGRPGHLRRGPSTPATASGRPTVCRRKGPGHWP
jgi:uncharacterized protein (DUF39 family)